MSLKGVLHHQFYQELLGFLDDDDDDDGLIPILEEAGAAWSVSHPAFPDAA